MQPDAADDVLQDFVLSKVLQQNVLRQADRTRGRFRTFLLSILDRFLIDQVRRSAVKRRHMPVQALDEVAMGICDGSPPPSRAFDLAWAKEVMSQAVAGAEANFMESGREDLWRVFQSRVLEPILANQPPPPYEELVAKFGFKTASQACSAVLTGRRTLARLLREIVAQYVPEDAVEAEIRQLHSVLSGENAG